jgi:hypothetical protein
MKYAFNTWAYSSFPAWLPSYPLDEAVRRIATIGYNGVEIGCAAPHAWPAYLNLLRIEPVRAFLRRISTDGQGSGQRLSFETVAEPRHIGRLDLGDCVNCLLKIGCDVHLNFLVSFALIPQAAVQSQPRARGVFRRVPVRLSFSINS